jgi:hypothetical protein
LHVRFDVARELGPKKLIGLVRQHGLRGTAEFAANNIRRIVADRLARRWDRDHNVDTSGSIHDVAALVVRRAT